MTDHRLEEETVWQLLLKLKHRAAQGPISGGCDIALDALSDRARQLVDLYLPLCAGPRARSWTVAHIGQSLDGYIAIHGGESKYITGHEDVLHTHRMRALADAVVIGRRTVECDDPRLTTRFVPGGSPTRVVLDPGRRLGAEYSLFRDAQAPTLVISDAAPDRRATASGTEHLCLPTDGDGRFAIGAVVSALHDRGLRRIFIEGGGVTVSEFLRQKALDRIHVTIAPIFLGAGRRGISLPAVHALREALRPLARRFTLGEDVLFDCELSPAIQ